MGLKALTEHDWLQGEPDLAARRAAFAAHPGSAALLPQAEPAGAELAAMLGVDGSLADAALTTWEDMCLLLRSDGEDMYRLSGAAVAFPTDWHPAEKLGLPLIALHAPIHGYEQQLATGVDRFMETLKPGKIYGRANWFVAPTGAPRWMADELPADPFAGVTAENAGARLFVRCERQTLRKLPESGAILFTIGIYTSALGDLTLANITRMSRAIATIPREEAERRGSGDYALALATYAASRCGPDYDLPEGTTTP
ncbi:heme-dependent oxidative N-demethylase family protein [Paraurantiacibacter namhicola]|uniref:DUF3445 domain-containing protein n=1 Tax=Paraurantiacibacter namhicola TaxID=645517 RepID=A0A1C7D7A8_9SPHN|nr:DUF3445 domain-containing protein [Paraurantiacibacter namhicola]ANU07359.1 hypothetical protein A6F65_01050 [Paraurantiacibacter namhicola]